MVAQAVVARPPRSADDPRPLADDAFERRLVVARRRLETAARAAGSAMRGLSVPSCSARTIVYKGLVAGGRLSELYPDLLAPLPVGVRPVPPALRHEHDADLGAGPAVPLDRPQRRDQHGPRQSRAGPRAGPRRRRAARSPPSSTAAGPLLSPDGSDSLSLDEGLELLTTTGWALAPALLAAIPEALGAAPGPAPARRHAAPPDGRHARAVGRAGGHRLRRRQAVGALIDRNGLRPASFAVSRDRLVVVASEAGAVPLPAADTIRRGRLGPGEMLLVEPGRRAILEDTDAKAWALRQLPIHDAPRPLHEDDPAAAALTVETESGLDHVARYLVGLDAERARLDIKTMALESHEPLWSMGDDTPTAGRGRLDRPVADHLRQAFAQVTNPAIDPERERIVMDLRVELGRRPALLGGPPRGPRTLRLERPIVADLGGLRGALRASGRRDPRPRCDVAGRCRRRRPGRRPGPPRRRTPCVRPRRASRSSS